MSVRFLASMLLALIAATDAAWYDGIDSITVLSSGDANIQQTVDGIFRDMAEDPPKSQPFDDNMPFKGQFGTKRRAILLRRGDYGKLEIPVNFYTSVMGVGDGPNDVIISSILSNDTYPRSQKGGLENFWRSVEGMTCTQSSVTWGVSQASPLRRMNIKGDLYLSQQDGEQVHYTSGGFMANVAINGTLHWGTQQQFFFRNSDFANVEDSHSGRSFVFVGVNGAPSSNSDQLPYLTAVDAAPDVAEKPYLVEDNGEWHIVVGQRHQNWGPGASWHAEKPTSQDSIPMGDVFVAKEGDNAETISAGIRGKRALLLTPAIYYLASAIHIVDPDFIVLGIGLPTLVTITGFSAFIVDAPRVRIAQVLIESGHGRTYDATAPLLLWKGHHGVGSDIFTRVGAFAYESEFHPSCLTTHGDIHVQVNGDNLVLDNTWFWHADHDDCTTGNSPASDGCYSGNGLVVYGENVTVYGLAVEHTMRDLVQWEGEGGQIFFFQSELPYHDPTFVDNGYTGYRVGYGVARHAGYGIGIYQVFPTYNLTADIRVPAAPGVQLTNAFAWSITTGSNSTLGKLICYAPGEHACFSGVCDANSCHVASFPPSDLPPVPVQSAKDVFIV